MTEQILWPSLLWPAGSQRGWPIPAAVVADLDLEALVAALDWDGQHARAIRPVLFELTSDPAVIRHRQQLIADLVARPAVTAQLLAVLPQLAALSYGPATWQEDSPVVAISSRLVELERLVQAIDDLAAVLAAAELPAPGWAQLGAAIAASAGSAALTALRQELPGLRAQLGAAGSVTVGVNLDADLRPSAAVLVSVQREQFGAGRSLLGRVLGHEAAPLAGTVHRVSQPLGELNGPLRQDLERLLAAVAAPVAAALARYGQLSARPLAGLATELAIVLGAATLHARLTAAGIALCEPLIAAPGRDARFEGLINLPLALQLLPVPTVANDVWFAPSGRVLIVTGPNHGGKTTLLRAIGQAQVLFQAGLPVPARRATVAPADQILTHFPQPESTAAGVGRLDDEAARLAALLAAATAQSLVLCNEPLTSTSEAEALIIARDVMRALQLVGARTVFVTHLHALAAEAASFHEGDEAVQSWVAGVDTGDERRTYRIAPGPPAGGSHAADVAARHGLTWPQLAAQLAARRRER